jgi:hypothetical protein
MWKNSPQQEALSCEILKQEMLVIFCFNDMDSGLNIFEFFYSYIANLDQEISWPCIVQPLGKITEITKSSLLLSGPLSRNRKAKKFVSHHAGST